VTTEKSVLTANRMMEAALSDQEANSIRALSPSETVVGSRHAAVAPHSADRWCKALCRLCRPPVERDRRLSFLAPGRGSKTPKLAVILYPFVHRRLIHFVRLRLAA